MKLEEVEIGQKVIYRRGVREPLYEKVGLILRRDKDEIVINGKLYYTFWIRFEKGVEYECMAENLDYVNCSQTSSS